MEASRATPAAASAAALPASGVRQLVSDLVALTKPKVQSLLLLTTVTTMLVAGTPSIELIIWTCIGGYLSAGGAGAVNHWYDRDIDAQMARTATRPIPAGRIAPRGHERMFRHRHCEEHLRRSNPFFLCAATWIASRSLSSGARSRDPVARNDGSETYCFASASENSPLRTRAGTPSTNFATASSP